MNKNKYNWKNIGEGLNVVKIFSGSNSLRDGRLNQISITEKESNINIEMIIAIPQSKSFNNIKIVFNQVEEFQFYHTNKLTFGTIELVKFFNSAKGYYLSLDPYTEDEFIDERDQDYIIARNISAFSKIIE